MANPNLGVSNDEEALLLDQAEAVRNPAKQNIFRCKHLNQWMTAASAWMNMSAWAKCTDAELGDEVVADLPCGLGSDLASKLDLAATVRVHRKDIDGKPHYYAFTRTYLPEARVNAPENQHYLGWSKRGHLTSTPGNSLATAPASSTCSGITGTYITCFDTVQNPLAFPWTTGTVTGYSSVQVTSSGAQATGATHGFAILSGVSLPNDQSARMVFALDSGWNVAISGVCIRTDI